MNKVHKTKGENIYDIINNIYSTERNNENNNVGLKITDYYSSSNDVFHINTSGIKLKDIILPKKLEEQILGIVSEHKKSDFLKSLNILPSSKILLEGEPGCGKTMIAYALSNMLNRELKIINLSKIVSPHLGETAGNISSIFEKYSNKEHIIFIDEFDIIGRLRGDSNNDHNEMKRIVNSLLQLIDYFPSEGILIFATNDIDIIDKALLRRMDYILNIPLPSVPNIKNFIKLKMKIYKQDDSLIDYKKLAEKYKGNSYSVIDRDLKNKIKHFILSKNNKDNKLINKIFN